MAAIFIIGFIVYVIFVLVSKTKPDTPQNTNNIRKIYSAFKEELFKKNQNNTKMDENTPISESKLKDDSIIDVTRESYSLNSIIILQKYNNGVPYWAHHYVYSYSEIKNATLEQKKFYIFLNERFLNGEYFDLEGNTNYAFILLFHLLYEYENHRDLPKLESQLLVLGQCYPKTKSYGISFLKQKMENPGVIFLKQKMESKEDIDGESRLNAQERYYNQFNYTINGRYDYQNNYTDNDYWKLGSKYKTTLNLKDDEAKLLNKLWYQSNNFCSIEFCHIEILKLYLATFAKLKDQYIQEETTLDQQFASVADVIARKHFKYITGSNNYKYSIETITNEIYSNIFKYCENAVRDHYGHKRKINTDTNYINPEVVIIFNTRIIFKVTQILSTLVSKITPPDEATEIELNFQNTNRWKIKFEELTTYNENPKQFIDNIVSLGILNKKNPSIENIFFEASKFISQSDKEAALTLYVHYLYHDLKSAFFDNKQLTKTIQKNLFKTNEQLHDFGIIISELIKDKNLEKALQGVSKIYSVKRKKIQLDIASIKEAQKKHSGTVELLNDYLKDEYEDENNTIKTQEINNDEVKIEITQKTDVVQSSIYISDIVFTQIHITTLEIFAKGNFSVPLNELETFAKSKGVFKNQLIESINEICFETLDDILIEEEDEYYTINKNYYQKLLAI